MNNVHGTHQGPFQELFSVEFVLCDNIFPVARVLVEAEPDTAKIEFLFCTLV